MGPSLREGKAFCGFRKVRLKNGKGNGMAQYLCRVAGDGVFATQMDGHLTLVDLKSNLTKKLVDFSDLKDVRTTSQSTAGVQ